MDDTDLSVTESQTGTVFRYVEADCVTYRKRHDSSEPDKRNYVFNFILSLKAQVKGDDDEEGGHVVELHFDDGKYISFVPATAWKSVERFFDVLHKNSSGLPAIFKKITSYDLNDYGFDKTQAFKINFGGYDYLKKRVVKLGIQPDEKTFIIGSDAVFEIGEKVVKRLNLGETEYIWIPGKLPSLHVPDQPAANGLNPIEIMADILPESTLLRFALTIGAITMGLHYKCVTEHFSRCPTVVCVGETNTGKTLCSSASMSLIASEASSKLEYKSISVAALRNVVFSRQNLPILLHDPSSAEVMKILVEESYEGKAVANCRESVVPGSSGIVTCNADFLAQFRSLNTMRGMSRCVIIPFTEEIVDFTARRGLDFKRAKSEFAIYLPKLLRFGSEDISLISETIDKVAPLIKRELERYGFPESGSRISFNIALLYAFAIKGIKSLSFSVVKELALLDFVVKELSKSAVTWQTPTDAPKRAAPIPSVPLSPSKRQKVKSLDDILEWILTELNGRPALISKVFAITKKVDGSAVLSIRDGDIHQVLEVGEVHPMMSQFRTAVKSVHGYMMNQTTRAPGFGEKTVKAIQVPLCSVSSSVIDAVKAAEKATVGIKTAVCVELEHKSVEETPNIAVQTDKVVSLEEHDNQADNEPSGSNIKRFDSPAPFGEALESTTSALSGERTRPADEQAPTKRKNGDVEESDDIPAKLPRPRGRCTSRPSMADKARFAPDVEQSAQKMCSVCKAVVKHGLIFANCARCTGNFHPKCIGMTIPKVKAFSKSSWNCMSCDAGDKKNGTEERRKSEDKASKASD